MKGSAVRIRASALPISRDFSSEAGSEVPGSTAEGSTRGLQRAAARPFSIASLIVMRRRAASRMTCAYVRAVKPGVGVAEVLGDLVQRAAFVEEQRGAAAVSVHDEMSPRGHEHDGRENRWTARGLACCATHASG